MGHNKREGTLTVNLHVYELLHIEAQHIIIVAIAIPVDKHGLTILYMCEILNHPGHRDVEEITGLLDGIVDVCLVQSELTVSIAASF